MRRSDFVGIGCAGLDRIMQFDLQSQGLRVFRKPLNEFIPIRSSAVAVCQEVFVMDEIESGLGIVGGRGEPPQIVLDRRRRAVRPAHRLVDAQDRREFERGDGAGLREERLEIGRRARLPELAVALGGGLIHRRPRPGGALGRRGQSPGSIARGGPGPCRRGAARFLPRQPPALVNPRADVLRASIAAASRQANPLLQPLGSASAFRPRCPRAHPPP